MPPLVTEGGGPALDFRFRLSARDFRFRLWGLPANVTSLPQMETVISVFPFEIPIKINVFKAFNPKTEAKRQN